VFNNLTLFNPTRLFNFDFSLDFARGEKILERTLLNTMKNIKKAFGPNDILNPSKIFDL